MNETLQIGDLDFEVRRSTRRKTLGLTVDRAGELVVHAPEDTAKADVRRWVESKLLWVHRKLLFKEEHAGIAQHLEFVSGESISYLGSNYRLKVEDRMKEPLRFDGQWFLLRKRDRDQAERHFRQWFIDTGTSWLRQRVKTWEPKTGTAPSRIIVDDLGYRWGSCGKNDVMYFNWRLLQLPVRLVDYIVVHEMTHLLEPNHNREFWAILDRVLPDWRDRKGQLEAQWSAYAALGKCASPPPAHEERVRRRGNNVASSSSSESPRQ